MSDQEEYNTPEYLAYLEESEAIHEGRATQLVHCYLCYLDEHGKADMSAKSDQGPLRGVINESTAYGFNRQASARVGYDGDPYAALKLSCGHTII